MLGPLLLFIYVNDVAVNTFMLLMCRLFADDNLLQYSSNNILGIKHYLNHDSNILESLFNKWLLKFNPSKTKITLPSKNNCFT